MTMTHFDYVIIGAGLAGASAISGIREYDPVGTIALIGAEAYAPYNRPPLSKALWTDKKQVEQIFAQSASYYAEKQAQLILDTEIIHLDAAQKRVEDAVGQSYHYNKLLLATGGIPKRLDIPGADLHGIKYYRNLNDYLAIRSEVGDGITAVVVGGGFIGSEIAAALRMQKVHVTMIFPGSTMVSRIFPTSMGITLQEQYQQRGIIMYNGDSPVSFEHDGGRFITRTELQRMVESDILIVGIGISPAVALAEQAGLAIENGITVNEFCQTSHPDIYAAGDNANFPYQVLGEHMRVEHWDNALNQGLYAGRNMTGANINYDYMPYFYSDLFEFGYEAVGKVDASLDIIEDWQQQNNIGVLYYLLDKKVRGVMTCNIYGKLDIAREIIKSNETVTAEQLKGKIS